MVAFDSSVCADSNVTDALLALGSMPSVRGL